MSAPQLYPHRPRHLHEAPISVGDAVLELCTNEDGLTRALVGSPGDPQGYLIGRPCAWAIRGMLDGSHPRVVHGVTISRCLSLDDCFAWLLCHFSFDATFKVFGDSAAGVAIVAPDDGTDTLHDLLVLRRDLVGEFVHELEVELAKRTVWPRLSAPRPAAEFALEQRLLSDCAGGRHHLLAPEPAPGGLLHRRCACRELETLQPQRSAIETQVLEDLLRRPSPGWTTSEAIAARLGCERDPVVSVLIGLRIECATEERNVPSSRRFRPRDVVYRLRTRPR